MNQGSQAFDLAAAREGSSTAFERMIAPHRRELEAHGAIKQFPVIDHVAAISVGLVSGKAMLDLNYDEDSRADVDMSLLTRTQHTSHCPYKGDASYYSISVDGRVAENAIWTYEQPFPGVTQIAGYMAFYPNRAEITVDPA